MIGDAVIAGVERIALDTRGFRPLGGAWPYGFHSSGFVASAAHSMNAFLVPADSAVQHGAHRLHGVADRMPAEAVSND